MDNKAYIPASGTGKEYYYLFSILDYEDIPIIFAASDRNNQIYLCDCVEFRDTQKWVIANTTFTILKKISTQEISVYDGLAWNNGIVDFVTLHYDSGLFEHCVGIQMKEMSPENLPDKNSVIHYPEPDVIEKIQTYSLALTITSKNTTPTGKTEWVIDTDKQGSKETNAKEHYDMITAQIEKSGLLAA